jgi:YD repeat-containing protein
MKAEMLHKTISNCLRFVGLFFLLAIGVGIAATGAMAQGQGGEVLSPIIENNVITGNTAGNGGGIASYNSSLVIRNNLLTENVASGEYGGGAIYVFGASSKPTVAGNTISANKSLANRWGGIYIGEGEATIANCILWQNRQGQAGDLGDLWNGQAVYSDVSDLNANPGTGNISADPVFFQTTDPDGPDYYRLKPESPCIDAGDPAYSPASGETELFGGPRIAGGRLDIGANESPDVRGPAILNVQLNGTNLTNGMVLQQPATITLSATDPSAVSRVEFYIDGKLYSTDTDGSDNYSSLWNTVLAQDGAHTLTITAYDSLGNYETADYNLIVSLKPPPTPSITNLQNGMVFTTPAITVSGKAAGNTSITLYNNNVIVGSPATADDSGNFRFSLTLAEGVNRIQATAGNRAGTSARTAEVVVTLDTSIPQPPSNVTAQSKPGGAIGLSWRTPSGTNVKGYNLYRAAALFSSPGEAIKVNTNPITGTSFDNIPPADGTYYYRVSTLNLAGQESSLSNAASALSDRVLPRAVAVEYTPAGNYDPATMRIATGQVNVRLRVSKPLQSTPFLSITPTGGQPIAVDLTKTSDTEYLGFFVISQTTPNGTAYAVFSGRDLVGNRGTSIDSGATFIIDTQGPAVSSIDIQPRQPIRNDRLSPVSIMLTIGLNEPVRPGLVPDVSYLLSGPGRTKVSIPNLYQVAALPGQVQTWQGAFMLPAEAGLAQVENLQFAYQGTDDLQNVSARILCNNSFQVYQGDLPPLDPPQNLAGKSLPGGKISLSWNGVAGAAGYQLYRQAPGEASLTVYKALGIVLESLDTPPSDGLYSYAVASVRHENSQEAISGKSNVVQVASDSIPPGSPQNLVLELTGSGIKARWDAPPYTEPVTYSLYRSNLPEIVSVQGMTPILTGISATTAVDTHPSHTEHAYVVTAVDNAGNESSPSNSFYLNFDLLPVASLKVVQQENNPPVVSWTAPGGNIAGYNIYLVRNGQMEKLNPMPQTGLSYTDSGFTGDERTYTVTAVDQYNVESLGRTITLSVLNANVKEGERLRRGIMNRLEYVVENRSSAKVEHVRLKLQVGAHAQSSDEFSVEAGSSQVIPVTVGGYADLADLTNLATTIEVTPQEGELTQIVRSKQIEVADDKLALRIFNEEFVRGGLGKVWFTLENTGEEEIEIVTATGSGASTPNDIGFSLLNADGNVLSSVAYKQNLGDNVITLPNGNTVARILAGGSFTSQPVEVPIPLSAPNQVAIQVGIAKINFHDGQPDQISIDGLSSTNQISLRDTSYYGEVLSVAPESSTGDEDIVIAGDAIERRTGLPLPSVPLNLVVSNGGFERTYKVFTDSSGSFSYAFRPLAGESGLYQVRAVHPEVFDRPVQGQFVVNRVSVNPSSVNLNIPRNYEKAVNLQVACGDGTVAHNLRLVYEAQDQPLGTFPKGVQVTIGTPVASLGSKQTASLSFSVWADNTADESGRIVLKVKSDETGNDSWTSVSINTQFSQALPALYYSPSYLETGVAYNQSITETVVLQNNGLADLNDVALSVISQSGGAPAPGWVYLNTASSQGVIAVGEKREVSLTFAPAPGNPAEGVYPFYLRVTSSNYRTTDIGLYVSVTQSGIGNAIFKVSDIYTGTADKNGQLIQGLSGAKITLQNEEVLSVEQTLNTDALGEAQFINMPAGRYKYRVSANNHQEQIARLWIKPGVTATEQVFLTYNLVTVEWQVVETTIQDRYDIVLTATYETNVPAAVVVAEPASVTLPKMKAGDVYTGEFTLTNYGLIRADELQFTLPTGDSNFKYELLGGMPDSLEAKTRITVPYRVIALKSLDQEGEGAGSGGGCDASVACISTGYKFTCANRGTTNSSTAHCLTYGNAAGCAGGFTSPSKPAEPPGGTTGYEPIPIYRPGYGRLRGACVPPPLKRCCGVGDDCCGKQTSSREEVHSNVDLLTGEYIDNVIDMFIKVPGHQVKVKRIYYNDRWHFDSDNIMLEFFYITPICGDLDSGQACYAVPQLDYINKDGASYERQGVIYGGSGTYWQVFSFKNDRKIYAKDDGYLWTDKSGNWAKYDLSGRLLSYGNPNNVQVSIIYESGENGKLFGIADNSGTQVLWYEYNANGMLSSVRDISGRRVQYFYDTSGYLSKVVDPLGNETLYNYDSKGRITSKRDSAGRTYNVAYDDNGFVKSVTDEQGIGTFFDYAYDEGKEERYSSIKYSSGKIIERWYDRDNDNFRTDLNGRTIQTLTKDGRTKTFTDAAGGKTYKEYDEWNNLTKQTNPDGTTATYEYELKFNQVVRQIDERGIVTTFEYDTSGNMLRKTEAAGTSNERVTEYTYDASGNNLAVKRVGDAKTLDAITSRTYDSSGNMISETDPEGNTTQFTYDFMGNALTKRDARGKVWTYAYDNMGRLVSASDPLNHTVSYQYDGVGNRTKETDPEGKAKTYEYENNNRLTKMTDALGNSMQFVYNSDGRLTKQIDQEGKSITYEYDLDGRLTKTTDGNGNETKTEYNDAIGSSCTPCSGSNSGVAQPARTVYTTFSRTYAYDSRGRKTQETDVLSDTETYSTQFAYDAAGNLIAQTDSENRTTSYQYDELDRGVKVIDPLMAVTEYTYDKRNNVVAVKDANGNRTTFEYDMNNRLAKETRPLGQTTTFQYDTVGNLIRKTDPKGQRIENEYDNAGRLTTTKYFATLTDTSPIKTVIFTYDKAANLTGYDDGTTSATYCPPSHSLA